MKNLFNTTADLRNMINMITESESASGNAPEIRYGIWLVDDAPGVNEGMYVLDPDDGKEFMETLISAIELKQQQMEFNSEDNTISLTRLDDDEWTPLGFDIREFKVSADTDAKAEAKACAAAVRKDLERDGVLQHFPFFVAGNFRI